MFRCPLTAFITFKSRREVAATTRRIKERQERQEIEIKNALMKRQVRQRLRSDEETTV